MIGCHISNNYHYKVHSLIRSWITTQHLQKWKDLWIWYLYYSVAEHSIQKEHFSTYLEHLILLLPKLNANFLLCALNSQFTFVRLFFYVCRQCLLRVRPLICPHIELCIENDYSTFTLMENLYQGIYETYWNVHDLQRGQHYVKQFTVSVLQPLALC